MLTEADGIMLRAMLSQLGVAAVKYADLTEEDETDASNTPPHTDSSGYLTETLFTYMIRMRHCLKRKLETIAPPDPHAHLLQKALVPHQDLMELYHCRLT